MFTFIEFKNSLFLIFKMPWSVDEVSVRFKINYISSELDGILILCVDQI